MDSIEHTFYYLINILEHGWILYSVLNICSDVNVCRKWHSLVSRQIEDEKRVTLALCRQ